MDELIIYRQRLSANGEFVCDAPIALFPLSSVTKVSVSDISERISKI